MGLSIATRWSYVDMGYKGQKRLLSRFGRSSHLTCLAFGLLSLSAIMVVVLASPWRSSKNDHHHIYVSDFVHPWSLYLRCHCVYFDEADSPCSAMIHHLAGKSLSVTHSHILQARSAVLSYLEELHCISARNSLYMIVLVDTAQHKGASHSFRAPLMIWGDWPEKWGVAMYAFCW